MGEAPGLRAARPDDAPALAELVNFAGEGLPLYLWGKMAEAGQTAWDVGRIRAAGAPDGSDEAPSPGRRRRRRQRAMSIAARSPPGPDGWDFRRGTEAAPPTSTRWSRTAGTAAGRRVGSAGQGAACDHMRELPSQLLMPPSITSSLPTVNAASSDARNTAAWAISFGSPRRPAGICRTSAAISASPIPSLSWRGSRSGRG